MPVHDWKRVDAGIFYDFHQSWIQEIKRALNRGLLPSNHYALAEQHGAGFEPDVPTLRSRDEGLAPPDAPVPEGGGLLLTEPRARVQVEAEIVFCLRKQNFVAVRHASGDDLVAVVELLSRGNKSGRKAIEDFVRKAAELIGHRIHLLILDLQPPTLAAYEASGGIRAFVEPTAVGQAMPDMPLFLARGRHVPVPLEATYQDAFESVPRRWRAVLETP